MIVLLLAWLLCSSVHADLSDLKVYSPVIEQGQLGLEFPGNISIDDDAEHDGFRHHEFELDYGATDYWATSLTFGLIKPADESLKFDVLGWENTFQFTTEGRYWLDLGLHLELEINDEDDEPNNLETRLLFRKAFLRFEHVLNLNFEQQWGNSADESTELEYIWRSKRFVTGTFSVGFEAFGTIGEVKHPAPLFEQDHRIGPAMYFDIEIGGISVESKLVWLYGLTKGSADNTFHWRVELDF